MRPVIGIPQMGEGLFRAYMKQKYVTAVRRAGGKARWIELEDVELAVQQGLECDGLLLPGGADIAPRLYGQEPTERCGAPNEKRDRAEFPMLEAFVRTGKPILCICRGCQLLNVFYGGTLHQDIQDLSRCNHSQWRGKNTGSHGVSIQQGTKLAELLGGAVHKVNSLHHQAADQVGPGLRVAAVSEDGIIEAVEAVEHPFCIGVQWHPEHMYLFNSGIRRLFKAFVTASRAQ